MLKRYARKKAKKRMTLIIGAKCSDGIILVSDKKVVDSSTGEEEYKNKLFFPLPNTGVIVGAAGYTHLFRQFNRTLPELVDQKLTEYRLINIEALTKIGEKVEDYEIPVQKPENIQSDKTKPEKEKQPIKKKQNKLARLPKIYSIECFLLDCKELIKEICEKSQIPQSLDVLIAVHHHLDGARLHHIDYRGQEEEVDFMAIGSGQPYTKLFKTKWDSNKTIVQSAFLLCFMIKQVEDLKLDKYVGVGKNNLPEMKLIFNDGRFGNFVFGDEGQNKDTIKKLKELTDYFSKAIKAMKF